jgi:ribosome-associated protein
MKTSQKNLDQPAKPGKKSDVIAEKQHWTVTPPTPDENLPPSKTKLKNEAEAQQALGVRLCELSKEKLLKLDLPESVYAAVLESKKITANGAIRRHRQYLGRLMREIDTAPIEEQLAKWDGKNQEENAKFHQLERWRERMIKDMKVLDEFIALYPQTDIQQMRTLIRNAQKEMLANKPPKSSREIFKLLREMTENESPDADDLDVENESE